MSDRPNAQIAAGGMIAGFVLSRYVHRALGGGVLTLVGAWCVRVCAHDHGSAPALGLGVTYVAAFGAAHPLAKQIGPWPSALAASATTAVAAHLFSDRDLDATRAADSRR